MTESSAEQPKPSDSEDSPAAEKNPATATPAASGGAEKKAMSIGTAATAIILAVLASVIVTLHVSFEGLTDNYPRFDYSVLTIITATGSLLGIIVLSGWFIFLSGLNGGMRLVVGIIGFLAVAIVCATLEPYGNSGDLQSWRWKWRWEGMPDEKLEQPQVVSIDVNNGGVDFADVNANMSTTGRVQMPRPGVREDGEAFPLLNFPQFLGPTRNGYLPGPGIGIDWDANPPKQLWKQEIGAGLSGFVAANGYAVTMEQRGKNELVTCYDINSGDVVWFHSEEARFESVDVVGGVGPRSTPTIHEGKVYAIGATGILVCLNDQDGSVVWRKDILSEVGTNAEEQDDVVRWGRSGSPLIYDDMVIVPGGGSDDESAVSLIAYDKENGDERWRAGNSQISYASPVVINPLGEDQIVMVNEKTINAYRPVDGAQLWEYERLGDSAGPANTSIPIYLLGQVILVSKGYGLGAEAFQIHSNGSEFSARRVWQDKRLLKTKFTNAVERNGYVYALSDGILECIKGSQGERMWKQGRYGHGQILMVDKALLVLAEQGYVALVSTNPDRYFQWTKFQPLEGVTWNTICLYGNKLLVRNSEMAGCWELPLYVPERSSEDEQDGDADTGDEGEDDSDDSDDNSNESIF